MPEASVTLDLVIIGSGPAALSAAIYATRAGLQVKVFERKNIGGTLPEIPQITNYPGFVGTGQALAEAMRSQAITSGAVIDYGECTEIQHSARGFRLTIDGEAVSARTVLIATGSDPRPLPFVIQPPVSYCALCDGDLVQGLEVAVVGGANSAVQESFYLAGLAKSVTIISHSPLKADRALQDRLVDYPNIHVQASTEPTPALLNHYDRVFVFIGKTPATACLRELAALSLSETPLLDPAGYVVTLPSTDFPHQTIIPGLFAAGDVRVGATRQVVTAAGDGAMAAIEISDWLATARRHKF